VVARARLGPRAHQSFGSALIRAKAPRFAFAQLRHCSHRFAVARDALAGIKEEKTARDAAEVFTKLLELSAHCIQSSDVSELNVPADEVHQEILLPLLPALLGDAAIRAHWQDEMATGFSARLGDHLVTGAPLPKWIAADFAIHVTASYSAGADARALADTLLSEEPLRDATATLMNQVLQAVWPKLELAAPRVQIDPALQPDPAALLEIAAANVDSAVTSPIYQPAQPSSAGSLRLTGWIRPQPWNTRANPLASPSSRVTTWNSLATNPLLRRRDATRPESGATFL
jgi:hypothetical protein